MSNKIDYKPISARLPADLREKIETLAQEQKRSLTSQLEVILVEYFQMKG